MDKQKNTASKINTYRAFYIYLGACVVLILIILFSAFQRTDGGTLSGEIYLRPNVVHNSQE